ncbi:FAD-dependent oxidoreductase [Microlunatus panaciterrae]|uniref:3-phenylpropionate/trans-cinnamate dioxygenase ferredoxin reductase subunit n=1 Tax=Microlunatus panaciterrae TaxID=400768 RepID=A0ABS2RMJ6_9ACTN|nr:FAD-dependent oxidoreductase [Microlunatus panaciterrae]MBM7799812.1 3-phenylpropionate/trans-cinnamate dioxygenase ferredoxin reductase subunit [Microlunatus panaciterrae]
MTSEQQTYLIVGGGLAAAKAAEAIRDRDTDGKIILVTTESELPYERPVLSKGYLLGSEERASAFVHDQQWYDEAGIEIRLGTTATAIDRAKHEVELDSGERLGYDKLLLATGSEPRRLNVPGADAAGVHYLRTIGDADAIKAVLESGVPLVVVGGGWIGLEVAAAAREHDLAVTVLELDELPLIAPLGREVAQVFADLHTEHGVRLLTHTGLKSIETADGRVTAVITAGHERIEAGAVVVGVGVAPRIELAKAAGLETDRGVLVDASLRSSDPDIFAAGDIAELDHPLMGKRVRVEHWAFANDSGPVAGQAMAGAEARFDSLPYFFTDQYDLGMEYIGLAGPGEADRVELVGDVPGRAFQAFWKSGDRVLAGMHVNLWDDGIDPIKQRVLDGLKS